MIRLFSILTIFSFIPVLTYGQDTAVVDSLKIDTLEEVVIDEDTNEISTTHIVEINRLLDLADNHLGTPYRYAGKQPGGFDCSGFVGYCYGNVCKVKMPASSSGYTNFGKKVSRKHARPGDVICFTGYSKKKRVIGHVGIITEVTPTEIYFIHASVSNGIRYDKLSSEYYRTRYIGIRRVLQ